MDYNFLTIGFRALYQRTKKVRRGLESEMSLFRSIISKFSYIFFQKPFFLSHPMLYKPISPTNIPITLEVFDSAAPAVKKKVPRHLLYKNLTFQFPHVFYSRLKCRNKSHFYQIS